jgi:hypothetical protein
MPAASASESRPSTSASRPSGRRRCRIAGGSGNIGGGGSGNIGGGGSGNIGGGGSDNIGGGGSGNRRPLFPADAAWF